MSPVRLAKDAIKFVFGPFWLIFLFWRGFLRRWDWPAPQTPTLKQAEPNPLETFFDAHRSGHGIWKWRHYFDVYHRHFERFRGTEVHVLEIGIYSGGSLEMWRQYFGPKCRVYGVDIVDSCRAYERDGVRVFIGNQADRSFWRSFWKQVPRIDIIIDDGGHRTDQQIITLEETLPHLQQGGVYLCEDVHGTAKGFTAYVDGLAHQLNAGTLCFDDDPERRITVRTAPFQRVVHSLHLYPFVTVIEKRPALLEEFSAPKHGTEWQPFIG